VTTVYVIRHGDLVYPLNDRGQRMLYGPEVPLSENGKNQISNLAARLIKEGRHIDAIYTSPYVRAVESAGILAHACGIGNVTPVDNFRDIDNSGVMGMTMDEVLARKGDFGSDPGVESIEHLADRMVHALESIVSDEQNRSIAIISHGDAIRTLLFRLEHPDEKIPPMAELSTYEYLDKGEVWCIKLDNNRQFVEKEYIGRSPELWGKGERKS